MKKGFYGKTKACLLSAMVLVTANAVPAGAQENNPTDHVGQTALYSETTTDNPQVTLGDTDGDGAVSLSDVKAALQATLKLDALTEEQKQAADVDGDGKVTIQDVSYMLKNVLNVIPDLQEVYNIHQLVSYINTYGEEDPDGLRFITSEDTSPYNFKSNIIYYYPEDNALEFIQMKTTTRSSRTDYLSSYFTYDISTLRAADDKINFTASSYGNYAYYVETEAEFDCGDYHKGDLPFVITKREGTLPFNNIEKDVYYYANDTAKSAIVDWDWLLRGTWGHKLSDIGFRSL